MLPVPDALVSTIIPVFNRAAMLREAVGSVLAQTHRPIEIVIVDDGSTDDTAAAAEALAAEHPDIVRVIHQPNGGVGSAREAGRGAIRGAFVQHLDSDDLLLPRKFELQVAALQRDRDAAIAYCRGVHLDAAEQRVACSWKPLLAGETAIFPSFLKARMWDTNTPLYRREIIDAAGPWTTLRSEEDWEYDCRIGAANPRLVFVDEELAVVSNHDAARLSGRRDPEVLRDRARAHALILAHARRAGVSDDAPEMQHFSRELFLLARQCGAAGLRDESRELFLLARSAAGGKGDRLQFRAYAALARLIGWQGVGKLAAVADRLRS